MNLIVIPARKKLWSRSCLKCIGVCFIFSLIRWSWRLQGELKCRTLNISQRADLVIYALTAHGQSCSSDRHSQTPSSRNKKCQLTLGEVTMEKRFGQEPAADHLPPWMFSLVLMPQQKRASDENDRLVSAANDNKSSQNSCQGWKSYIHIRCERSEEKMPSECTAEASHCFGEQCRDL